MIGIYTGKDANIPNMHRIQPINQEVVIGTLSPEIARQLSQIEWVNPNKSMFVNWEGNKWTVNNDRTKIDLLVLDQNKKIDFYAPTAQKVICDTYATFSIGALVHFIDGTTCKQLESHENIALWTRKNEPSSKETIKLIISSMLNVTR